MHRIAFAPLLCGLIALAGGMFPGWLERVIHEMAEFRKNLGMSGRTFLLPDATVRSRQREAMVIVGAAFLIFGVYASFAS